MVNVSPVAAEPARSLRRRVYDLLEPRRGGRTGFIADWFIVALIAANVAAVVLETVDTVEAAAGAFFTYFEVFSVVVFTGEYLGRAWAAVEDRRYAEPIAGRLRFLTKPLMVVDLLAIAPFYLMLVGVGLDLRFLRALRLLRLFRLLKLARYTAAARTFADVFRDKKEKLVIAVAVNGLLLLVASSLMYFVERAAGSQAFASIPEAMWWGVATLARLPPAAGYTGATPVTFVGQLVGACVAILGIGLFALPASILAGGFMEATDEPADERCPHCGEPV